MSSRNAHWRCWEYKMAHTATLEGGWQLVTGLDVVFITWPSNCVPCYLPRWTENLAPYRILHRNVYCGFIRNCHNLEGTKMSFGRWMDKHSHAVLFRGKEKGVKPWKGMEDTSMHIATSGSQSEKAACYRIPSIWHFGKENCRHSKISGSQWLGKKWGEKKG